MSEVDCINGRGMFVTILLYWFLVAAELMAELGDQRVLGSGCRLGDRSAVSRAAARSI